LLHYDAIPATIQKITALASRPAVQARDIFDLYILSPKYSTSEISESRILKKDKLEKALIDSLYLSARKKKQFSYFPELYFPKSFSFKKDTRWVEKIPDPRIKSSVEKKLTEIKNL